jgi:hypothetical protein
MMTWIARGTGLLASGFFLIFTISEFISEVLGGRPCMAVVPLLAFLAVPILGVLITWRWEMIGGALTMLGALGLGIFVYLAVEYNKTLATLLFSVPFLIADFLVLTSWWGARASVGVSKKDSVA